MVSRKINQRSPIRRRRSRVLPLCFLALFVAFLTIGVGFLINTLSDKAIIPKISIFGQNNNESASKSSEKTEVDTKKINFQPLVDEWVKTVGGSKGIMIYDLERNEVVGAYNIDQKFGTASLYKLFVVYEGYRKIQNEEWSGPTMAGKTGRTILQCLDLAIRESNSNCAETLWTMMGRNSLETVIKHDYDITDSNISKLVSTPQDITKMMRIYFEHKDISDQDLVVAMKDSFLNQPTTEYNWRQGFPSGFSKANVYNKVGWDYDSGEKDWRIYHDTAIVEFPEQNRHFVVTVMTNHVPFQYIRDFGTRFEEEFYSQI